MMDIENQDGHQAIFQSKIKAVGSVERAFEALLVEVCSSRSFNCSRQIQNAI